MSPTYLSRDGARDLIREQGVPIGDNALKDLANRESGPRYSIINGRALYTREHVLEWIKQEAAQNVRRPPKERVGRKTRKPERRSAA